MSSGSRARLSRFSVFSRVIALSRELFRLAINHFPSNQFILKCSIAIGETPPLLFPLLWRRLRFFSRFNEVFEGVGHNSPYIRNRELPPPSLRSSLGAPPPPNYRPYAAPIPRRPRAPAIKIAAGR